MTASGRPGWLLGSLRWPWRYHGWDRDVTGGQLPTLVREDNQYVALRQRDDGSCRTALLGDGVVFRERFAADVAIRNTIEHAQRSR